MKACGFFFVAILFSIFAQANEALDPEFRYCRDLEKLEKMPFVEEQWSDAADPFHIDRIVVSKVSKKMYLIGNGAVFKKYTVALGPQPGGHKHFEGDGKTPEGLYIIDFKKPDSDYNRALHISYPNQQDLDYANAHGQDPGGDIMIHGFPVNVFKRKWVAIRHPKDWTRGCIAVTNAQIEEIYQLVQEQTLIEICPQKEQSANLFLARILDQMGL
jgi:murein L,D-transpeptidase YafK